ncbi:hypothetical protein MTBSS4_10402 [Magnetospirillum sp. SS-4]|nr:hypothetical protein MTBSS4_10402 [Magnetospirillum sp. SS-4]
MLVTGSRKRHARNHPGGMDPIRVGFALRVSFCESRSAKREIHTTGHDVLPMAECFDRWHQWASGLHPG